MNENELLALHYNMLAKMIMIVREAYRDAVERGDQDPIVLLLDPCDERAQALALLGVDSEMIDLMAARASRPGMRSGLAFAMSKREAIPCLALIYPELAEAMTASLGDGIYLAIVIAFGGGQIFTLRSSLANQSPDANRAI